MVRNKFVLEYIEKVRKNSGWGNYLFKILS